MISIIIIYRIRSEEHNELWELTNDSINGILATADEDYELIMIDNGSHDDRYANSLNQSHVLWGEMFKHIQGFRQFRFEEHVQLGKAWNTGIHQADGEYIMLINNDILYHETSWMTRLLEPFNWTEEERLERRIKSEVGIVGIQHMSWYKFAFVEGVVITFPAKFKEDFDLRSEVEEYADYAYPVVMDEQFMYISDVDFSYRVQQAGFEVIQVNHPPLQPRFLQHLGHRTIITLAGSDEDFVAITHKDRIDLCKKWGFDPQIND